MKRRRHCLSYIAFLVDLIKSEDLLVKYEVYSADFFERKVLAQQFPATNQPYLEYGNQ